jgi:hypothetical protein
MITMRGISRFIAETLDGNAEFIALSNTQLGEPFKYFVNVDLANLSGGVPLPYFGIVTFDDQDAREVRKYFKTQFLIGIARTAPTTVGGITEEASLEILETLSRKAVELVTKEMRTFGVQGDSNIRISFVNFYVPNPDGEDDLQMQVDLEFDQDKYLTC